jgi:prepilin-type N-terminal cleavage/methylation domain-containing protein
MRSIISTLEQKASDKVKVPASNRSAFTLVELMVVVAIMAVLGALVAGVVVKAIEAQKNSNTKTTMEVIKSALSKQLQAVIDDGKDKARRASDLTIITNTVKAAFPTSLTLATSPNYLKFRSVNSDIGCDPDSYLLRMILDAGPFSKLETDMLPKGAISTEKAQILDAWGEPIKLKITIGTTTKFVLSSNNISETVSN